LNFSEKKSYTKSMNKSTGFTLRLAVFVYDCLRLSFLLVLLLTFTGGITGPAGMFQAAPDAPRFPYMIYAAPHALFPLMSLFLLLRFAESRTFLPLYMTGKLISVAALAGWIFFFIIEKKELYFLRWSFFLGAADLASAVGAVLLRTAETAAPATGNDSSCDANTIPGGAVNEALSHSGGEQ
jgi:hypothetical protein